MAGQLLEGSVQTLLEGVVQMAGQLLEGSSCMIATICFDLLVLLLWCNPTFRPLLRMKTWSAGEFIENQVVSNTS